MGESERLTGDSTAGEWHNKLLGASANETLSREANPLEGKTTSLYGTVCKAQPEDGELPVLKPGEFSTGCSYQKFEPDSATTSNLKAASGSAAHIFDKAGEWSSSFAIGSGTIVAASADKCFVLTDNHVVAGTEETEVVLPDGIRRTATVFNRRPSDDLAMLQIDTGAETGSSCKVASVSDSSSSDFLSGGTTLSIIGYPAQSKSLYVSDGIHQGLIKRKDYRDGDGDELALLPGENPERPVIAIDAHVVGGNSGSSVFNQRQELGAVLDAADSNKLRSAFATPINKTLINEMLEKK